MISRSVKSEVKTGLPFQMVMSIFNKDSVVESGVDVASRASRIFVLVVTLAKVVASTFGQQRIWEVFSFAELHKGHVGETTSPSLALMWLLPINPVANLAAHCYFEGDSCLIAAAPESQSIL